MRHPPWRAGKHGKGSTTAQNTERNLKQPGGTATEPADIQLLLSLPPSHPKARLAAHSSIGRAGDSSQSRYELCLIIPGRPLPH